MFKTESGILLMDGAMGTMLQAAVTADGMMLKQGEGPEVLNMTNPDAVKSVHAEYFKAGSDMVLTNTFGASKKKLAAAGYSPEEVIKAAVRIAREAANEANVINAGNNAERARPSFGKLVALDVGPLGELLEPAGTLTFDVAYELFKEQIIAGTTPVTDGIIPDKGMNSADAIVIETMTDLLETKCALLAAKENSGLPVFCTMSYEANHRTFMGVGLAPMALTLEGLGADAIGLNCSVGPAEMYDMVAELRRFTNLPLIVKPNAGLPELRNGKTVFNITEDEFSFHANRLLDLGVTLIGGCCGTTPGFISKLAKVIDARKDRAPVKYSFSESAVCSCSSAVKIDRVRIVGERINPTGKKRFQQALIRGDTDYLNEQAAVQIEAGADILDVNVGYPRIDERSAMIKAVQSIQSMTGVPLQIDSVKPEVIEAALRIYNGKPIVNSVNGEEKSLAIILPIVKKYGAMLIGLTLDEKGIPRTAEGRLKIAERIVSAALAHGIPKRDIIIDCLTLTAGAEQETAYAAIDAIRLVKENLNVKTILGVSNISFGLPARDVLNKTFLTLAMGAGLDLAIINPNKTEMTDAVYCFHQLKNIDRGSADYIGRFVRYGSDSNVRRGDASEAGKTEAALSRPAGVYPSGAREWISRCVANGLKDEIKAAVAEALKETESLTVVNDYLIPALDEVGKNYETGRIFLPQLLHSAEAAKAAFVIIKEAVSSESQGDTNKQGNKIILATVKGDIHDIGKNIVKVVLENYGYNVIDLGRDVEIQRVVDEALAQNVRLVGLSALMTTTVDSMEKTIRAVHKAKPDTKIMAGGAVLTEELAQKIGADYYAKDATDAVKIAGGVFK